VTREEIALQTGQAAIPAEEECGTPPLLISLFGLLEARRNGMPLPRLRTRKGYALLALLAVRHGGPVERSWLAGTLWPESSEAQALANLRNSLKDLRRALGKEAGRLGSPAPRALRLELGGAVVDLLAFDKAVARGDAVSLAEAAALYRGPLLEGWTEEWVFPERQAREQAYLAALETLAEHAMAQQKPGEAERYLRRAVATDPLRESAQRGLMQALAAGGNYAGATKTYRDLRLLLHRELNAEPDAETAALFQQIRAESRQRALPRRTINDERPRVGTTSFTTSPTSPPHHSGSPPHNLPRQLTRFIGREPEMTEVKRLLATTALLTVTGAGGCGKTRLALQMAPDLLPQYPDGVWLVELASLSDPALVPQTVASVLRVQEEPGRPLSQTLAASLQPRSLLLVLDNCEHLLAACAALAETLLRACPHLQILATSREVLGIAGEQAYQVPSLSLPDPRHLPSPERLLEFDAVRLFVDRAVLSQSTFTVTPATARAVVQVCQRLDGIPLAIELAAARVKALSVEKLNERLDDMFGLLTGGSRTALPRHRTLRALIDWSYDFLSPSERALLGRLSIFAGGWTLEAAEAVCVGEGVQEWEVLELLTSLVEKSLVLYEAGEARLGGEADSAAGVPAGPPRPAAEARRPERVAAPGGGEGRYRLLETVRQYARERLLEAGEAEAVRGRHLDWFLALVEAAEPELVGARQRAWLDRLERDYDNLRAALAWSSVQGQSEAGLRVGAALWWFWDVRGYWTEGREHLVGLLALPGAAGRTEARAKALNAAGYLAQRQGEYGAAQSLLEESLVIFRELGHKDGIAWSLNLLGTAARRRGNDGAAQAFLEESLAIFRELGNKLGIAISLDGLGEVACSQRECRAARSLLEESLAIFRELGNKQGIAGSLGNLGCAAGQRGEYGTARLHWEESLAIFRELGHKDGIAWALGNLAGAAHDQGDLAAARSLWEENLATFRELGNKKGAVWSLFALVSVVRAQGDHEKALSLLAEARAIGQGVGDKNVESEAWIGQGHVLLELGDYAAARSGYEEGLALRRAGEQPRLIACALLEVGHAAWLQGAHGVTHSNAVEALALFERLGHHEGILAALENLAVAAWAHGRQERAARLMGAVEAQREALELPGADWWRRPRERIGAAMRGALGEPAFAAAWEAGRALSLAEAMSDALDETCQG
jgi:predicted ATPase/DNA-binding SARP family transcriptional activator